MKKYIFKIFPAIFKVPKAVLCSPIQYEILNERLKEIEISVMEESLQKAKELAMQELSSLLESDFGGFSQIEFYKFALKTTEINVLE